MNDKRPCFDENAFQTVEQLYLEKNQVGRSRSEATEHARETFNLVRLLSVEIESRRTCPRPTEALKNLKTVLDFECFDETAFSYLCNSVCLLPPSISEEMSAALQDAEAIKVAQPSWVRGVDYDIFQSLEKFSRATDYLLSNRRRGPRPSRLRSAAHHRLRSEYIWLTGQRPNWTNDNGLRGAFIEFQKKVYCSVGIMAPSQSMLRGDRRRQS